MTATSTSPDTIAATPVTRRTFGTAGAIGAALAATTVSPRVRRAASALAAPATQHTTVVIWLKGGCDALSVLAPIADPMYRRERPTLALAAPGGTGVVGLAAGRNTVGRPIGPLAFHPAAAPLVNGPWAAGHLDVVMGVGFTEMSTRSHFLAAGLIERSTTRQGVADGYLNRFLDEQHNDALLGGLTAGTRVAGALQGPHPTVVVPDLATVGSIALPRSAQTNPVLERWYRDRTGVVAGAGTLGFQARTALATGVAASAGYPTPDVDQNMDLSRRLADTAAVIRSRPEVRVVAIDMDTWDTHTDQAADVARLLGHLSTSLARFWSDLGAARSRTTVVVMSEFGREIRENGGGGTDHGSGGISLVLDERAVGGLVGPMYDRIEDGPDGDLAILTDVRDVLAEVLVERGGCVDVQRVFAGYRPPRRVGLFRT